MHQAPQFPLPLPIPPADTVNGGPGKIAQAPDTKTATWDAEAEAMAKIDWPEERRCDTCHCLFTTSTGPTCNACQNAEFWF